MPETREEQARCRAGIVRGKAATARARTPFGGRTVTLLRVGRSNNRTVARVRLADSDVASELVTMGTARWWRHWQRKPDWRGRSGR